MESFFGLALLGFLRMGLFFSNRGHDFVYYLFYAFLPNPNFGSVPCFFQLIIKRAVKQTEGSAGLTEHKPNPRVAQPDDIAALQAYAFIVRGAWFECHLAPGGVFYRGAVFAAGVIEIEGAVLVNNLGMLARHRRVDRIGISGLGEDQVV